MGVYTLFISGFITLFLLMVKNKGKGDLFFYYGLLSFLIFISLLLYNLIQYKEEIGMLGQSEEKGNIRAGNISKMVNVLTERKLDVPLLSQLPELPRGCEVTSLAMLLQYDGVNVGKMELAENVKKDSTPMTVQNGLIHFGNPHNGFVGDMYSYKNPGYGVYHQPIEELAESYIPNEIINLTGNDFGEVINSINNEQPVWIITNTTFKKLPDTQFDTWDTEQGQIKITYREHSVVVTGYNENYIYFNDPLTYQKDRKIQKENFIAAWEQMGKQAIAVK
ncbi:C39 family peptidase [Metabacillus herbersteinensis]|uniref:C39 family peptidase n=1 Tax=Metabacillus herbersteinensis TaxID=283816 RepID=A0ABV6GME4_9BACI